MGAAESAAGQDRPSLSEKDIVTKRLHRRSFLSTFGVMALTGVLAAACSDRSDDCRTVIVTDGDPFDSANRPVSVCDGD